MSDEIFFDGARYLAAHEAASQSDLSRDYIARLCRDGKIAGKRVGKNWYVDENSFKAFLVQREYAATERGEALASERRLEYQASAGETQNRGLAPAAGESPVPSVKPVQSAWALLDRAMQAPSGISDAALKGAHVPVYLVTPAMEFLHKLIALTLAFLLTFGTFAAVDPQYAQFAAVSARDEGRSIALAFANASHANLPSLANTAQQAFAAAAADPAAMLPDAPNSLLENAALLARAWNASVDSFVYALAFPGQVPPSVSGTVAVSIEPYAPGAAFASAPAQAPRPTGAATIVNNPVIEREIQTQRVITQGGISEQELDQKLQELDNKLSSQMYSLTSANSTAIAQNYNVTAQTNAIDQLTGTAITNATIAGGSITGASIAATSLSADSLSVSGATNLADTNVTGNLAVQGSLNLENISLASSTLSISAAAGQTSNLIQVTNASGSVLFAVEPDGTLLTTNSSSTQIYTSLLVAGGATTTSLFATLLTADEADTTDFSALNASITNLAWVNATGTNTILANASSTNFWASQAQLDQATSTNFFATTASSTNLFAQAAAFGGLSVSDAANLNGGANLGGDLTLGTHNFNVGRWTLNDSNWPGNGGLVYTTGGDVTFGLSSSGTGPANQASFEIDGAFIQAEDGQTNTYAGPSQFNNTIAATGLATLGGGFIAASSTVSGGLFTATFASSTALAVSGEGFFGAASTTALIIGTPSAILSTGASGQVGQLSINPSLSFSANTLSLNTANQNSFSALQQFSNATATELSATQKAYFGTSGQSSFDFNGALTLATPLAQTSGGTGIASYGVGDILYADGSGHLARLPIGSTGNVLTVQAGLPAWGTGGGSGGAVSTSDFWATTTNDLAQYPVNTARSVLIGESATSSMNSIFEVSGQSYFSSLVGIGTTSPATTLSVGGSGYLTGGLGVGVLNTSAGTLQTEGNATIGGTLVLPAVAQNALLYNNNFNQVNAASVDASLTFSGGTLALNLANPNSWSALQTFGSGLIAQASSTVGNGVLGLTINGNATTTGTAYFAGNVGIGTTNPGSKLEVQGTVAAQNFSATSTAASQFPYASSTALTVAGNTFLSLLSVTGNATLTNATSSNFFATTASSTNLFAQTASLGALLAGTTTLNSLAVSNTSTSTFAGGVSLLALDLTGSATSTAANGFNIASGCFAIAGTCLPNNGYVASAIASNYEFPLTGNATSTLTQFNAGLTAYASSTIGNGIAAGGLTVNGNATTTGIAYFGGNVGIGTTSPWRALSISSATNHPLVIADTGSGAYMDITQGGGVFNMNAVGSSVIKLTNGTNSGYVGVNSSGDTVLSEDGSTGKNRMYVNTSGLGFRVGDTSDTNYLDFISGGVQSQLSASGNRPMKFTLNGVDVMTMLASGNVGIGTTTPGSLLSLNNIANFTAATSTFYGTGGINLAAGCFALNGTCLPNNGYVAAAVASAYPFALSGNATSTLTQFNGGLTAYATSTIGDGVLGLTINGSATTTGTAYFAGTVGIGTTTPGSLFSIGTTAGINFYDNATSTIAKGVSIAGGKFDVRGDSGASQGLLEDSTGFHIGEGTWDPSKLLYSYKNWSAAQDAYGVYGFRYAFSVNGPSNQLVGTYGNASAYSLGAGNAWGWTIGVQGQGGGAGGSNPGTVSNSAALYAADGSISSNLTNYYGLYVASLAAGTHQWGIYQAGSSDDNYFAGNVGIGTSTPGSLLSLGVSGNASGINFSFATSTFSNAGGINLTSGCFAINGACLGSSSASSTLFIDNNTFAGANIFSQPLSLTSTTGTTTIASGQGFTIGGSQFVVQQGSGNVGIGTTSPSSALSVAGNESIGGNLSVGGFGPITNGRAAVFASAVGISIVNSAANDTGFVIRDLGTGSNLWPTMLASYETTGRYEPLAFWTSGTNREVLDTDGSIYFGMNGTGGDGYGATSTAAFSITSNGNVGIGTTTPWALLSVAGLADASYFNADNAAATSSFAGGINVGSGALEYDYGANTTYVERLSTGPLSFQTNAGEVSMIDMPITSGAAAGTVESYTAQLNSNQLLTMWGESDGAGSVQKLRVVVGTSTDSNLDSTNIPSGSLVIGNGALCVDNNGGASCAGTALTAGQLYAKSATVGAVDLAENYPTQDASLVPGEIVSADPANPQNVIRYDAASSTVPLGIVSTAPGFLLGFNNRGGASGPAIVPVALAGRVPLWVSLENGPIEPGDYLAPSPDMPGYAMKATQSGMMIGISLDSITGDTSTTGTITAFVKPGFALVDQVSALTIGADGISGGGVVNETHVQGSVAADAFIELSASIASTTQTSISQPQEDTILSQIASTAVFTYRDQEDATTSPLRIGLVAGQAPSEVLSLSGDGIDVGQLAATTFAGLKSEDRKVNALTLRVANLESAITQAQGGQGASPSGGISLAAVLAALQNMGASIAQGLAQFAYVVTQDLVVGSPSKPSGITLYDTASGQPYCFEMANGAPTTTPGVCTAIPASQTAGAAGSATDSTSSPQAGTSSGGDSGASSATSSAPVLELNGNNPATVNVGATYSDPGATITGPTSADLNLGVTASVDGATSTPQSNITVDTSAAGTHTIIYSATDQNGLTGSISRTVNVIDPNASSTDATSTTP